MYSAEAQYFDGQSSKPQPISLSLNPNVGELNFSMPIWGAQKHLLSKLHFEHFNGMVEIRNESESVEVVKVSNEAFIGQLVYLRKQFRSYSLYQRLIDTRLSIHFGIAIGILGALVAFYFYGLPTLSEKAVHLLPMSFDQELGRGVLESFLLTNEVDSCKTESISLFVDQLDFPEDRKPAVTVVQSPLANAFALPDGNIVIFSGILDIIETPDELAALIGHESAHIYQRHSMKMLVRNVVGYVFISAVLSDVNGVMSVLAENAHSLQNMSYSKQFEKDADLYSIDFLRANNLNVSGATDLFHHLQVLDTFGEYVPDLLRSHPLTIDRIAYLQAEIANDTLPVFDNVALNDLFAGLKSEK